MDPVEQQLQCCIMSAIILAIIGPATYWLNSIILIPEKIGLSPAIGVAFAIDGCVGVSACGNPDV
jgi:hypothetical protein